MSEQIIIKNKTGLDNHGATVLEISKSYETAVSQAYNRFSVTVDNQSQQGRTIAAFIDKLNTIQRDVFEVYPQLLADYSRALTDYASSLEQAGFNSDELSSSLDGVSGVKTVLMGDQYELMSDVKSKLQGALNQAASALGNEAVNLAPILQSGETGLSTCSQNRSKTHEALFEAQTTFVKALQQLQDNLAPMAETTKNARYIGSLSVTNVIDLIQNNQLTSDNIKLLDKLQGAGDGKALDVILRYDNAKPTLFKELGKLDATHMSQPMMDIVYGKFYAELSTLDDQTLENQERIQNYLTLFLNELSQQPTKNVQSYTEKLVISGDRFALILSNEAIGLMPEFPKDASGISAYNKALEVLKGGGQLPLIAKQLEHAGMLTAFFESLYVQGVGKEDKKIREGVIIPTQKTVFDIRLTDGRINYKTNIINSQTQKSLEKSEIDVEITGESGTVRLEDLKNARNELLAKRQEAIKDFVMDMATSALPKGYSDIFDMINSTADVFAKDSELHQRLNGIDSVSKELLGDKYSERASKGLGRAAAISEFISNLSSIEAGLLDIDDESKAELFNIGGYTVRNTAKTPPGYGKYSIAYDLQAILQLHELETYGLRPYIYRANGGDYRVVEAFDKAIASYGVKEPESFWSGFFGQDEFQGDTTGASVLTKETKALLAGQGGSFSETSIVETHDGIKWLKKYLSKDMQIEINDPNISPIYSHEHYRKHSQEYFEGLVKP